jgi:hypothetical protein
MMLRRLLAFLAFALLLPSPALAWWDYGHKSVATIAFSRLNPETKREIARLIAHSAELDTPQCPIHSIEDAAYWPDCIRLYKDRFNYTFSWHYQDIHICRPFDIKEGCKDGNCVTVQIQRNMKLLADRKLPARERLMALAFLAHFVGDLHQPLHVGERGDNGGNKVTARYGAIGGTLNLHSIWDGLLAERAISTAPGGPLGLMGDFGAAEQAAMRTGTLEDWTRESWQISHDFAYGSLLADPCATMPAAVTIDEATTQKLIPIVRRQIARGGIRLARLLEEAFTPNPPPVGEGGIAARHAGGMP